MGIMARRRVVDKKKNPKPAAQPKAPNPEKPKPTVAKPSRRLEKIPASMDREEE